MTRFRPLGLVSGISFSLFGCVSRRDVARSKRNIQALCVARPKLTVTRLKSLASFSQLPGAPQDISTVATTPLATMCSTATSLPPAPGADQDLVVKHDEGNQEFVIALRQDKAFLKYQHEKGGSVDLWTTEVPPPFRGRGVAKVLAQAALDHFSKKSIAMRLSCTYLQKYTKDFPQPTHQKYIISD